MLDPKTVLEKKAAMTPTTGFNVVGIDTYGDPDEQGPYLVGNYATREEADAVAQQLIQETGERHYVYEPAAPAAPQPE